ncbi:hypothetical protein NFI96_007108, partial [Prochilodus magdalenae]
PDHPTASGYECQPDCIPTKFCFEPAVFLLTVSTSRLSRSAVLSPDRIPKKLPSEPDRKPKKVCRLSPTVSEKSLPSERQRPSYFPKKKVSSEPDRIPKKVPSEPDRIPKKVPSEPDRIPKKVPSEPDRIPNQKVPSEPARPYPEKKFSLSPTQLYPTSESRKCSFGTQLVPIAVTKARVLRLTITMDMAKAFYPSSRIDASLYLLHRSQRANWYG